MIVAGSASPLLLASAAGGYNLTNSLRFRSSASAYLSRTPASNGNRRTWTYSAWIKRGDLTTGDQAIIAAKTDDNNRLFFYFQSSGIISFYHNIGGTAYEVSTSAVYRDPSAWYHFVISVDTTQATASNRLKFYVNGVEQTLNITSGSGYVPQNTDTQWNSNILQVIAKKDTANVFLDGYFTEINNIDGQALTPSSFGQTSATTGVWQPKKYAGTYGTNGYYLPFTDNSALTTSSNVGLGKDFSGNGNYWTTNNISITAGVTYDSMTDVPTLTDETTANFAVLNPLQIRSTSTINNGNLNVTSVGTSNDFAVLSTMALPSSGKFYWECNVATSAGFGFTYIGVSVATTGSSWVGFTRAYQSDGSKYNNTTGDASYGNTYTSGDLISVAVDMDAGKIWFGKNGTWQASGNPATGANAAFSDVTNQPDLRAMFYAYEGNLIANFGQRPFAYTPPTGFLALNTFNLPTPTIGATATTQANKYFDINTYTGTGASNAVVNSGAMPPAMVWLKSRNITFSNYIFDIVRGAGRRLVTNNTTAEGAQDLQELTSFNSNGFTVGTDSVTNATTNNLVAWQWRGSDSSAVTNTDGSITSTVSANTSAGFSVVTWTSNGTGSATVGHGLGVAPKVVIYKRRNDASSWFFFTSILGNASNYLLLDTTDQVATASNAFTSTTFQNFFGASGATIVAYAFAEVAGYSKFGSYTGNGSSDGPFIYTGFRPKYVMVKLSSASGEYWYILDSLRNTFNPENKYLAANDALAEGTSVFFDFVSNGFKIRVSDSYVNTSGATYIYMAFAESPFKYANAR
jgi:hypothetical protein